jgi:hypothetical protein
MSAQLDYLATRAAAWSQTADELKRRLDRARWFVLGSGILGALVAAVASQIQLPDAGRSIAHALLTGLGAALLAIGAFISSRLLRDSEVQSWVRARAAAEALKREAFKYATGASPYDSGDADSTLDKERSRIEGDLDDLADRESLPARQGSSPRAMLSPDQYREKRIRSQIHEFYRPKALAYGKLATRLRLTEFWLALAAAIITALSGALGKLAVFGGVSFDPAALTAVLTTVGGAILAHIEASRYQHLVTSYLATARRLEEVDTTFAAASSDPKAWSEFVNRCEDIIGAENNSWVARWTKPGTA